MQDDITLTPTPERMRRGVELVDRAIPDEEGRPSQPYRSIDILAAMHRRGAITAEMRFAGEDFQTLFAFAQLDPLKAADYSRPFITGSINHGVAYRVEQAREAVWKSLQAAGGVGNPGGSCLWHVLGWGKTLKEWATECAWNGRRVGTSEAAGILIAALGVLAIKAEIKGIDKN